MTRQNVAWIVFLVFVSGWPAPLLAQGAENKSIGQEKVLQTLRVTAARANVRDSASMKAEVLFQVSRGDILRLIEKSGDWYWIEASDDRRGYIHRSLVEVLPPLAEDIKSNEAKSGAAEAKNSSPNGKVFRNSDVIEMSLAGLSEGLIADLVMQSVSVDFDLSASALIELKKKGVSEDIIRAMMVRAGGRTAPETANSILPAADQPKKKSQTVKSAGPIQKEPGKFGAGLFWGLSPGGAAPAILYDLTDRVTLSAALGLYTGVTGMMGELLYRFTRPLKNPPSDVFFEPYLGGGLILVSVSPGFGANSDSFTGFIGSGGTFMTIRKIPRWRFSGGISLVQFNVEGIAVAGIGTRLGFHYFF